VPGFSAHGAVDNLHLVFSGIGRATDRPKERSEQKAAIAATDHANPGRGDRSQQTAAVATNRAGPDPGKCPEQTAAVATSK
jgi:hypothetical protein